jgi:hypothetical protein
LTLLQIVLHLRTQLVHVLHKAALEDPDINIEGSLQQMDDEKRETRIADELCALPLQESGTDMHVALFKSLSFALSNLFRLD